MISRDQVINRLREGNYYFFGKRKRVELYRQRGSGEIVSVPLCDLLDLDHVRVILRQAGLRPDAVEAFIATAVKSH